MFYFALYVGKAEGFRKADTTVTGFRSHGSQNKTHVLLLQKKESAKKKESRFVVTLLPKTSLPKTSLVSMPKRQYITAIFHLLTLTCKKHCPLHRGFID